MPAENCRPGASRIVGFRSWETGRAFDVAGRARRVLARSALAVYLVFIATFAATRSGLL